MKLSICWLTLHLAIYSSPASCRRGGGGHFDGDGAVGSGSDDSDGSLVPSDAEQKKFSFEPTCHQEPSQCFCWLYQPRLQLYALPGLYYNGTLTVTHRVSDNSAYAMEALDDGLELGSAFTNDSRCPSDDCAEKTYKYPALFHVGPRGNNEDPNPLHWSLTGFQHSSVPGYVDLLQRVVHVRSSDFFVERPFRLFDYWDEANANDRTFPRQEIRDENTTAYWTTSVVKAKNGKFYSAHATYDHQTPNNTAGGGYAKSQYITLSETCKLGFTTNNDRLEAPLDPDGEDDESRTYNTTALPTVWLQPAGTEITIDGIGSDKLTLELTTDVEDREEIMLAWSSVRRADCEGLLPYENDFQLAYPVAVLDSDGDSVVSDDQDSVWSLKLSVLKLTFEGSLVRENSTEITGLADDGRMQFAEGYDWEATEKSLGYPYTDGREDSQSRAIQVETSCSLFAGLLGAVAGIGILAISA